MNQRATPQQNEPAFEGRLLHRPGEDLEDQGLAFDLGTLLSRRRVLGVFGAGAGAALLAACAPAQQTTGSTTSAPVSPSASATPSHSPTMALDEMPGETAGPYPGDGSNGPDVLDLTGVERRDITTSIDSGATAEGVPVTLTMNIIDMAGGNTAFVGAAVYVWHCDAAGRYSMYSSGIEDETYLRGVQVVGKDGAVTFQTVFSGCYSGRWPHIHFEVFPDLDSITDASNAVLTSQIALPEDASAAVYQLDAYAGSQQNLDQLTLATDNVFGDDSGAQQLGRTTGNVTSGYTVTIDVPIDTTTEPDAGGMAPGAGPGGAGAPPAGVGPGGAGAPPAGGPGGTPPSGFPGGAAPTVAPGGTSGA